MRAKDKIMIIVIIRAIIIIAEGGPMKALTILPSNESLRHIRGRRRKMRLASRFKH